MALLQIQVLGPPRIQHGEHLLTFSTRKALALLIYLAVEGGIHSRKTLSEFFWPNLDAEHGRAALRSTVLQLRDALEKPHAPGEHAHLLITRDTLGIDLTASGTLDIHVLNTVYQQVQASTYAHTPYSEEALRNVRTLLEWVMTVAQGAFLADFTLRDAPAFDDWARGQREHWHVLLLTIFDRLSLLYEEAGQREQAMHLVKRWLAFDPLHEEGTARLMRLYAAEGNRRAALQTYEAYRTLLASELNVEPEPALVALAEGIRHTHVAPSSKQSEGVSSSPPSTLLDGPFVGRAKEFSLLIERFKQVQRGSVQVVLIEGEAGIGKTRLATELLQWSAVQGADVLQGKVMESAGHLPYQPFLQALRPRLERENAPEDLLSDEWLSNLSRLFPELRERYPDLPLPLFDETLGRGQLFEAVYRLFQSLAARHPLVLLLDDVQWADTASLDLILYLVQQWEERTSPILLLLCMRNEAIEMHFQLTTWSTSLSRIASFTRISLQPFTAYDTEQWLVGLLQRSEAQESSKQGSRLAQRLSTHTGGNPFYLQETLRALLERGVLVFTHSTRNEWSIELKGERMDSLQPQDFVSTNLRDLLRHKLSRLTPAARMLLIASVVLNQQSTFEYLCEVAQVSEHEGLTALDELLQSRFMRSVSQEQSRKHEDMYVPTHDLIREVVYSEAGRARQRVFHRRALELLKGYAAPAGDLAYHAKEAGSREEAFHYSLQAGDEAMAVFALQDAVIFYEQARRAISLSSNTTSSQRQQLLFQLGRGYELLQCWTQAQKLYATLRDDAQQNQDECLRCIALNHLVQVLARDDAHLPQVRTLLLEARQAAEQCGDEALLKETLWNEFQQGGAAWDQAALEAWGEQKAQRFQEFQNWLTLAQLLVGFGYDNPQMTQWEQAQASVKQAITWYQQQGNREMEVYGWDILAGAQIQHDALREGVSSLREAQRLIEQSDDTSGWVITNGTLSYFLLAQGLYQEAWQLIQKTIYRARKVGYLPLLEEDLFILGDVSLAFGQEEQARQAYQEGLDMSQRLEVRGDVELLASRLCIVHAQCGEWEQALSYAEQAQAAREDYALPLFLAPSQYETETWLRVGKRDEAEREIERLQRRLGSNRRHRISLLRSKAVLAQWDENTEQVIEYFYEARTIAEDIGLPGERWQIQAALGDVYEARGDSEQAQQVFASAAAIVQELAGRIQDEALRASFVATPQVQRVVQRKVVAR